MTRRDTLFVAILVNAGVITAMLALSDKGAVAPKLEVAAAAPLPVKIVPLDADAPRKEVRKPPVAKPMIAKPLPKVEEAQPVVVAAEPLSQTPEAPVVVAAEPQKLGLADVVVKKGDVLEKIARAAGSSTEELMILNNLSTSRLAVGQTLKVPSRTGGRVVTEPAEVVAAPAVAPAKVEKVVSTESGKKFYTVKQGDSPWTIAVKNHIRVDELLKLNNLDEGSAKKIRPGQKLRVQ